MFDACSMSSHVIAVDSQNPGRRFEQFNEQIGQRSGKKWSSYHPGSRRGRAPVRAQQGYVVSVPTALSPLETLQEHFAQRKRPMNVIFYLLFSVGIFVLDTHL